MIEVADSNAVSYYHFDGLGSVVALSNSAGNTIQTYEYSVYGEVAAEDPNHPNPFMFTGRRFDFEILRPGSGRAGLYYYRARYYNPYIGRFLQIDPIGYDVDMNLYRYCMNNPWNLVDPSGACCDPCDPCDVNDSNDCAWEEYKRCMQDASIHLNKCLDKARETRDRALEACRLGLLDC